jgi:hypothetical protein
MKIVGIGVCGPGEADRYMRKTLNEFKRLCDETLIVTCNATQQEKDLINEYGFKQYEDNREWGKSQPLIKEDLLRSCAPLKPDWVVFLDMDEVFAPEVTRQELERLAATDELGWYFLIVNLYNDEEHFAHDVGIQRFWNVRYYKYTPEYGFQFQRTNVHCGPCPIINWKYSWHAPYYVLHYGLMKPEDRAKKVERYQKYDPKGLLKPMYYEDLKRDLVMRPFEPQALLRKLKESNDCKPRKTPKVNLG